VRGIAQSAAQESSAPIPGLAARSSSRSGNAKAAAKSEGAGGRDVALKNAEVDCAAGRYEGGIWAMEELLGRNGYTVPPS